MALERPPGARYRLGDPADQALFTANLTYGFVTYGYVAYDAVGFFPAPSYVQSYVQSVVSKLASNTLSQ